MLNLRAPSELARLGRCPPRLPSALTRLGVVARSPRGCLRPSAPRSPSRPRARMLAREPLLPPHRRRARATCGARVSSVGSSPPPCDEMHSMRMLKQSINRIRRLRVGAKPTLSARTTAHSDKSAWSNAAHSCKIMSSGRFHGALSIFERTGPVLSERDRVFQLLATAVDGWVLGAAVTVELGPRALHISSRSLHTRTSKRKGQKEQVLVEQCSSLPQDMGPWNSCTRDGSDSDDTGLGCACVCRSWIANSTSVTGLIQTHQPRRYRCCTTTVQL
ncbi:hypothetical protein B0H14DRAFT_3128919 [Mycena olivaceomarginata]|nr:hypothetical protein B0H14DRAFT_3128919 [Mycena olivaceomarginata]